jgi:hypothetical protein
MYRVLLFRPFSTVQVILHSSSASRHAQFSQQSSAESSAAAARLRCMHRITAQAICSTQSWQATIWISQELPCKRQKEPGSISHNHKTKQRIIPHSLLTASGKGTNPVLMISAWTLYSSAYTNEVTARGRAACSCKACMCKLWARYINKPLFFSSNSVYYLSSMQFQPPSLLISV